jgi:hypothetical protein
MGLATAACGEMMWSDEVSAYLFSWPVPPDYQPNPVVVVQIDIFEGEELLVEHRCLRSVYAGQVFPIAYHGDGGPDGGVDEAPDPGPKPALALEFDPDLLLRLQPVLVAAGSAAER